MALLRVVVDLEIDRKYKFPKVKEKLIQRITLAAATQRPVDPVFEEWMQNDVTLTHYWEIQTQGKVKGVELFAMGFWNLVPAFSASGYASSSRLIRL